MINRRRGLQVVGVLLVAWLMAWLAARSLIVRKDLAHADSIVVLAGSGTYKERARKAAQLVKDGYAREIVLTDDHQQGGWSNEKQRNPFFVEMSVEQLRKLGVPREEILTISPDQAGTYHEAIAVRDFVVRRKLKSILIVTSSYHSRRALWIFQRVFSDTGVDVGLYPVETGEQTPSPLTWWLYLKGWQMVPGEYIKFVYYRFRY